MTVLSSVFTNSRVRWGLSLASIAGCIALWHLLATLKLNLGIITFEYVPPPAEVVTAFHKLVHGDKLLQHLVSSLERVLWGYLLAALSGIVLGILIGRAKLLRSVLLPPLELLRPIPAVAWIPLAILMFPSSEASMIFITFTGALFPVLLSTIHGVEGVDQRLIASAKSLGASPLALLREVIIPGAAPAIVTGLAIGMGTSWFCLVTAEMVAGQWGIGYYTWESFLVQRYPDIVVGMIVIGLLGMGSSGLIRAMGNRAIPWYFLRRSY